MGAIHSTKISGNFGPKLDESVRSNRKSFDKTGPLFEVVLFSRSDRSEFCLNGSRPIGVSDENKVSKTAIDETILEVIAAFALPFQSDSRTLLGR